MCLSYDKDQFDLLAHLGLILAHLVVSCCQFMSVIDRCCQLFSVAVSCCQLLSVVVSCCKLLSGVVRCCHALSIVDECCQSLLVVMLCYPFPERGSLRPSRATLNSQTWFCFLVRSVKYNVLLTHSDIVLLS